jgi:SAM-dependent methyltransferase
VNPISTAADLIDVLECAICGSSSNEPFESLDESERAITYRLCCNCGTVFQSPRMTEGSLKSYYEAEYVSQHQQATGVTEKELRIQAGRARHLVQMLKAEVAAVERHLDVGSSTGSLMLAIKGEYGNEAIGIEPAKVYRAYCAARGLTVIPDLESLGDGCFDLITLAHVVEHLPDPVNYLQEVREEWLTPEGTLLVEVPNLYGHRSVEIPHLFCFSAETLRYTLAQAGYEVIRMQRHGSPRSKLIPLYLTAIARPVGESHAARSSPRAVRLKRKSGMAWNRFASRIAPGLAWLPLPSLEGEPE